MGVSVTCGPAWGCCPHPPQGTEMNEGLGSRPSMQVQPSSVPEPDPGAQPVGAAVFPKTEPGPRLAASRSRSLTTWSPCGHRLAGRQGGGRYLGGLLAGLPLSTSDLGAALHTAGCGAASQASAPLTQEHPSHDNHKGPQIPPSVPWGAGSPPEESHSFCPPRKPRPAIAGPVRGTVGPRGELALV